MYLIEGFILGILQILGYFLGFFLGLFGLAGTDDNGNIIWLF